MNDSKAYNWITRLILFSALLFAGIQLVSVLTGEKQLDFKTYYYAAKAYQHGLDPYELASLRIISGQDQLKLPFVYPPHCLTLFMPLTHLHYDIAYYLFLTMKLTALLGLIIIWLKIIPTDKRDRWILFVTILLGYRYAVLRDIRAGNVSMFEQLLIWGGILLILQNRHSLGGVGIALSSTFKFITAPLAALVFIIHKSWVSFGVTVVLFMGIVSANLLLYFSTPQLWIRFLDAVSALDERGNRSPSSLAFLRDMADVFGMGDSSIYIIYGILCCTILTILVWSCKATRGSNDIYPLLYLAIFAYVLLIPRLKDYSLILVLLPTLHTLGAMTQSRWQSMLGLILLWIPLIDYQSLFLSAYIFFLVFQWIWNHRNNPNSRVELSINPLREIIVKPS